MQRNTVQRTLTLETVRSMTTHPTADEVYATVRKKCPSISKGTVYRLLGNLADEGEILRVAIANAPDRFDLTIQSHAHFYCRKCCRVYDYPSNSFPSSLNNERFLVERIDLVLSGQCSDCLNSDTINN